ncbi:MAG: hypothetical protein HKN33_16980 [Pyrinomonadaceae bacterium]|nr:hypothetical protein [Pyrinomonadaceae bacterium]
MENRNIDDLRDYMSRYTEDIENTLRENLPEAPARLEKRFGEIAEAALFESRTRVRPYLTLLAAELVGGEPADVIPAAVVAEYVDAASNLFSSRSSVGIAVAVALLNASYPLVFVNHSDSPANGVRAHAEIVECVRGAGIVGSFEEQDSRSIESARLAGKEKSAAIVRLALRMGAILSGADYIELAALSRFAEHFGNASTLKSEFAIAGGDADSLRSQLEIKVEDAKKVLVEEFSASNARSCLIQLTDFLVS